MKLLYWNIVLLFWLCIGHKSKAASLEVGYHKLFSSITTAIQIASDGDTIIVFSGIYKEGNIILNKELCLIGIDTPIIDGELKSEVMTIKANNVSVSGFIFKNSGYSSLNEQAGIRILEAQHICIDNNLFVNNYYGIYLQYASQCIVRNNRIQASLHSEQQSGNGIHCWKSDSLQIIHNEMSGHRDGIYFEFVTHSLIWRNISYNNIRYGLHFMFSNENAFITNVFHNNGAGVAVMYSKKVSMLNNYYENNKGDAAYGMLLKEMSDCDIIGNHFTKNTTAIFMDGVSRNILRKNSFSNNGWGMRIQASCMDNLVENNNFIKNSFDVATNGNTVLNVFSNNYWDAYSGYDINKDQTGDVPYRPLSLFSVIAEKTPSAMLLFQSIITSLIDQSEKIFPSLTPDTFIDNRPAMKPHNL